MIRLRCITFLLLLTLSAASTRADTPQSEATAAESAKGLSYTDSVILGLVEGITEYLPVSSTGHLILTDHLLGLDTAVALPNREGELIMVEGDDGTERPFTQADAADAYVIIIQFGAIAAVALIYWRRLLSILMGVLGRDNEGLMLLRNLIVAFLPAAVLGLLLKDFIKSVLFGIYPVIIALVAGGILMLVVNRWHRKKHPGEDVEAETAHCPELHELSIGKCLVVGFLQCIAMWPGTSRSMMTIVGGYLVGLSPVRAAEFSFLLGFVTLSAASAYETLSVGPLIFQTVPMGPILLGIFIATISAVLAVEWLLGFLMKHGLAIFAWYRIALALLVLLTFS